MVGNGGIDPLQPTVSIEDVYWKAVGDDLSKWENAAREVYKKTIEFPPLVYEKTKEKYADLIERFQGVDLVLSAFGADMGIPIFYRERGWMKGTPTVDFSTTFSGLNIRFNFKDDTKLKVPETDESSIDQVSETISFPLKKPRSLRYFGVSFNSNDSWSILCGTTVAIPFYNPSISADAAARVLSDYGTAVGRELGEINRRLARKIDHILYDR